MEVEVNDIGRAAYLASYVQYEQQETLAEAIKHVKIAMTEYGFNRESFLSNKIYLLPIDALKNLNRRNRFVAVAADKMQIPYPRAYSIMFDIRAKYGIGFREFGTRKLYRYTDEVELKDAVRAAIHSESRHIQQVCRETGWTVSHAEQKMRATKKKFPTIDFRKYSGYGIFAKSDEDVQSLIDKWNSTAKANRDIVRKATGWSDIKVRSHMTRFQVVYDIIPAYYICYRAWELSDSEIDGYARQKISELLSSKYNDKSDTNLLGRKDKFNGIYSEYSRRKFWVNEKSEQFEDFQEFAKGLTSAFCKPLRSGGGLGTFKLDLDIDAEGLRRAYDDMMSKPLVLVEETVKQHEEVSAFYPHSVNTVRVVTLQDENGVHVISTGIRFGSNSITDNFSADGMVSDIDIESGRILTPAVDKKGNIYERHPYSGKSIVDFVVPHWGDVIDTAVRAMGVLAGVNYVGWDIAIGPDSVCIIEGNSAPDLVLVQAPYAPGRIGKKYLFDPYL